MSMNNKLKNKWNESKQHWSLLAIGIYIDVLIIVWIGQQIFAKIVSIIDDNLMHSSLNVLKNHQSRNHIIPY